MRTFLRGKITLLFMTLGLLLAIPAIALADNAISDGDAPVPLADSDMAFGDVGCNVASDKTALIAINRTGSGTNVFKDGSKVTVTVLSVTGAGLSAQMDASPAEITLPSNWGAQLNNTKSATVSSKVTINSSAPGAGTGTVVYRASGVNSSNATINRDDTMNVSWTTGSCDTTAPSVTSISTANTNPTNTTGNLKWNVTFSESVTGVDRSDFNLANTGLGGSPAILADPDGVSGSGASYTVTASSGTGTGTLGLNLTDNDSIKDAANNLLGGTDPGNGDRTGDVYVIDRTLPTLTGSAVKGDAPDFTGASNYLADTWTNKDVRVTFACTDNTGTGGSGLTSGSGNNVQNFTTETDASGVTATSGGTCVDNAGNTAAAADFGPIKIDKTNPTINGSRTPPANSFGWNNGDVAVSFNCADPLSDIASCGPDVTLSSNGASQSATGTATDNAGNTANATVSGINIDKTNPNVSVTGVSNGATYTLGSVPAAGCSTTDALSGVDANATLQPLSGGPVGAVTATCSGASDKAGNSGSASVTYNVHYNWTGFFQPIDNNPDQSGDPAMATVYNSAKAGQAIPIKFNLSGNQGLSIFATKNDAGVATSYPRTVKVQCPGADDTVDAIETFSSSNAGLQYDPIAGQYIYTWKTATSLAGTCQMLDLKLADGTHHYAFFQFKR